MLQPINSVNFNGKVINNTALNNLSKYLSKEEFGEFRTLCNKAENIKDGRVFSAYTGERGISNSNRTQLICGLRDENWQSLSEYKYGEAYCDRSFLSNSIKKVMTEPRNIAKALLDPLKKLYQ